MEAFSARSAARRRPVWASIAASHRAMHPVQSHPGESRIGSPHPPQGWLASLDMSGAL